VGPVQGEIVQMKYAIPAVATRQLEIFTNAVLLGLCLFVSWGLFGGRHPLRAASLCDAMHGLQAFLDRT
jgi:hypothetical protein